MSIRRLLLSFGLILVTVAAAAATPPVVSTFGQYLTVDGVLAEEGAILKVVGPEAYGLMREIARGESVSVDLLQALQTRDRAATSLPAGLYHYEVISRPNGDRIGGSFRVGAAPLPLAEDAEPTSLGDEPEQALNADDNLTVTDVVNDGLTAIDLDSDGATDDLHWGFVNEEGILTLREHDGVVDTDEGVTNISFARSGGAGSIGIGTELPLNSIDIQAAAPIINMTDTDGGSNWKLMNSGGDFLIQGPCESDCDPFERWNVVIVEDGAQEDSLVIDSTGVSLSSSRAVKKNLEPVASTALLDELAQLPIYTWSYARDDTETVHVGPMAEDFHERFGFGNDATRLSPVDTGGLALAAIQGLRLEVREKELRLEQEVRDKDARLEAMARRLEELERLIAKDG